MTYSIRECPCGHRACNRWYLSGPDVMMSAGSGFDGESLAQKVCDFLNKEVENDAAVQIAEEAFRAGFKACADWLEPGHKDEEPSDAGIAAMQAAWDAYEPSEAIKDLTR